jgi:hypothetical protein
MDPNFHVDADSGLDPDSDPERHQHDADPHADRILCFTHDGTSEYFSLFLVTALPLPVYNVLSSYQC